jgi:hypothetical protein
MVTNRPVLATDIEPWAVRVAGENAKLNRVAHLVSVRLADGWRDPLVRAHGPYDLVFANILARPLCLMARDLALNLAPSGTAILAGLLACQARWVLSAHRAQGLRLERMLSQGLWTTIVIRKPPSAPISKSRSRLRLGRGGVSPIAGFLTLRQPVNRLGPDGHGSLRAQTCPRSLGHRAFLTACGQTNSRTDLFCRSRVSCKWVSAQPPF